LEDANLEKDVMRENLIKIEDALRAEEEHSKQVKLVEIYFVYSSNV